MNFNDAKKELKEMFKKILEYQKKGINPNNKFINYFYYLVYNCCNLGNKEVEEMYNLHFHFIEN